MPNDALIVKDLIPWWLGGPFMFPGTSTDVTLTGGIEKFAG
jgi:hypothetical protein